MNRLIGVRISEDVIQRLEELEQKAKTQGHEGDLPTTRSGIVQEAILEYYARVMDQTTSSAYSSLMLSTLHTVLGPYFETQKEILTVLFENMQLMMKTEQYDCNMNRASFDLIFRSGGLTEDPEQLKKILSKKPVYETCIAESIEDRMKQ